MSDRMIEYDLKFLLAVLNWAGPEMHGKAEAEPEPLTLETLFDIYGEDCGDAHQAGGRRP